MNDDIIEQALKDPELLKELFIEHLGSSLEEYSDAESLMREAISIEGDRRQEKEDELKACIQRAINRGESHRFSGFLDNDKS